jgi:hypothetical protein
MRIAKGIFGASGRTWRGVLGVWTAVAAATTVNLAGVDTFLSRLAAGTEAPDFPQETLTRNDLFHDMALDNYWGITPLSQGITNITKASPGVCTLGTTSFAVANGDRLKIFVKSAAGMVELDNRFVKIANKSGSTVQIKDAVTDVLIDTSGYTTFNTGTLSAYFVQAPLFDAFDTSEALHISDPTNYPSKYTYCAQRIHQDVIDGSTLGLATVLATKQSWWAAQKVIADANGWRIIAYEGGNGTQGGDASLTNSLAYPAQFTEFVLGMPPLPESARTQQFMFAKFIAAGASVSSKFEFSGIYTQFGPWAAYRYPGDSNPTTVIMRLNNEGKYVFRLTAAP